MSKWEDKYNQYKDGGIDNVISELLSKGITTKEQKKEYAKLVKIKEKMPQIDNVIEYRDKLKEELNQLKAEIETRKTLAQASEEIQKLGREIDELQEQSQKIAKQLKDPKITDEKRAELQAEQDKIGPKMAKAQDTIQENENILNSNLGRKNEQSELSTDEIKNKVVDTQTKISKCNLVAHNLLNGLNWDLINMKLDNWQDKKFTSKDGKLEENIKRKREEKVNEFMENYAPNLDDETPGRDDETSENNKPALTFADKHPRLAKIGNFFKGIRDRFTKKEKEDIQSTEPKEPVKKEESFKEYIREVAEKGLDGIAAEEKAARQKAAKQKLEEMRTANRVAEAVKYGPEYAKQSDPRSQNDGR